MIIIIQLIIILICLFGSAFYAGIETGIISIHRMRLEHKHRLGDETAGKLRDYLDNPDRLLGTTLVGNNICVVIISVVSVSIAEKILAHWGIIQETWINTSINWTELISTLLTALIVLIFGEYLPKIWFYNKPQERCSRFIGVLRVSEIIFMPLSKTTIWITGILMPRLKSSFATSNTFVTKEDLKILTKESADVGELSPEEQLMINRVFELSHKRVHQIMIPLNKITFVNDDISLNEFFKVARDTGFTRIPAYNKKEDKFTGIINVFYVLSVPEQQYDRKISEFIRPPLLITEDMPVDDVLPHLRRSRNPTCLATNANGKVTGLVALEDILEEIVGEL
jgi:CBS domain containing-hemolysin-like protein